MYVEGKFEKDTTPHIHPNSVKIQRLAVLLKTSGQNSDITIFFDGEGKVDPARLPTSEDLQKGLDLMQVIENGYKEQGLKPNSHGYSMSHY